MKVGTYAVERFIVGPVQRHNCVSDIYFGSEIKDHKGKKIPG